MSDKRNTQALRKIIAHIDHTLEYCNGMEYDAFMDNRMQGHWGRFYCVCPQCPLFCFDVNYSKTTVFSVARHVKSVSEYRIRSGQHAESN